LAVRSFIPPWFYRNVHQIRSRFLHFLHALLTLQLDAERSCHRLLRWLKRAALRSKRKSKQRYKMFLDASASSSPSKSPMHYAHTDGGVSAIRCLNQSVDEPLRLSSTCSPSRCLRGSFSKPLLPEPSQSKVFPELAKQPVAENL
jgi:hypothetical protein